MRPDPALCVTGEHSHLCARQGSAYAAERQVGGGGGLKGAFLKKKKKVFGKSCFWERKQWYDRQIHVLEYSGVCLFVSIDGRPAASPARKTFRRGSLLHHLVLHAEAKRYVNENVEIILF